MRAARRYHAHVYFDVAERRQAVRLRAELDRRFGVIVGRVHDRPIGPHPKPMFQVLIRAEDFGQVIPWLMQHRDGLDVLVHPDSGNDLADHRDHAAWLGDTLSLDLSVFKPAGDRPSTGRVAQQRQQRDEPQKKQHDTDCAAEAIR